MSSTQDIFSRWQEAPIQPIVDPSIARMDVLGQVGGGGSGSFRATIEDPDDPNWWITPTNSLHGPRAALNEWIVGQVGALIGAPVCPVRLVEIGVDYDGTPSPGRKFILSAGVAIATRDIPGAAEDRNLRDRNRNSNPTRHVGVDVLYDLCWGDDAQWLYQSSKDESTWSHDHGMYLGGVRWDSMDFRANADTARRLQFNRAGLNPAECERIRHAVGDITHTGLIEIMSSVPAAWQVPERLLQSIGAFVEVRARRLGEEGGG